MSYISAKEFAYFTQQNSQEQKKYTPLQAQQALHSLGLAPSEKVITIAALKGGVGKTFLSTHAAVRASMLGLKVLIVDLDPEACASNSLLNEEDLSSSKKQTIYELLKSQAPFHTAIIPTKYPLLDLLPSSLRVTRAEKIIMGRNPKTLLKKELDQLDYDLIFLELPPSFSTLSTAAYLASDRVVIPCTPNIHSLESVDLTLEAIREAASEFEVPLMKINIILNMFRSNRISSQDVYQILQEEYGDQLFTQCISESAEVLNAINAGLTIYETQVRSSLKEEMDSLVKNILELKPIEENIKAPRYQNLSHHETQSFSHPLIPGLEH